MSKVTGLNRGPLVMVNLAILAIIAVIANVGGFASADGFGAFVSPVSIGGFASADEFGDFVSPVGVGGFTNADGDGAFGSPVGGWDFTNVDRDGAFASPVGGWGFTSEDNFENIYLLEVTVMGKGYIRIITNNSGTQYATHYVSKRVGDRVVNSTDYLGTVIDLENGIFRSRKRGLIHFDINDGFKEIEQPILSEISTINQIPLTSMNTSNRSSLDFGGVWMIDQIIKKTGYIDILNNIIPEETDTLLSYICFNLLFKKEPNYNAQIWYDKSYARIIYPQANLSSQRLSEFMHRLGNNERINNFFNDQISFVTNTDNPDLKFSGLIIIDGTLVENQIKMIETAFVNHGGSSKNVTKIIVVIDSFSKIPLIFRCIPGNIIDVVTLENTLAELKSYGLQVEKSIVDAGFYSRANVLLFYKHNIPFVTRLVAHTKIYKNLVNQYGQDLSKTGKALFNDERLLYGRHVEINLHGRPCNAYILEDFNRRNSEIYQKEYRSEFGKTKSKNTSKDSNHPGTFIILSSEYFPLKNILKFYYCRQNVEQCIDTTKNNANLVPPRVHSFESYRGHVLGCYLSTTVYQIINTLLDNCKFNASRALFAMNRLSINLENGKPYSIEERRPEANIIINKLKLELPEI
jgi:hypothetical protein